MKTPRVSVLMPVKNGAPHVAAAVRSILGQTFSDFEFIIIDDGSTDDTAGIVEGFRDPCIRLVRNRENLGIVASLNKGLELANGEYVARMDADDISRPQRLERQVSFLDANRAVGVCGSWVQFFPEKYVWKLPATTEEIRCRQFSMAGVAHPSVMMRREVFIRHALFYNPDFRYLEDYELWDRALKYTEFANIQEVLLDYRISPAQVSTMHRADQLAAVAPIRLRKVRELGIEPTPAEQELHELAMNCSLPRERGALEGAEQWLLKLQAANRVARVYNERYFGRWLLQIWFSACLCIGDESVCPVSRCIGSPLWSVCGGGGGQRLRALGAWVARKEFWIARRGRRV